MKITKTFLKKIIKEELSFIKENDPMYDPFDDAIVPDETQQAAVPDEEYESVMDKIRELESVSKSLGTVKISFLNTELDKLLDELSEMADVMPRRR